MSNLPGNQYFAVAADDINYPGAWDELEAVTALLQTNAHATLALAYEQRTANLIALQQFRIADESRMDLGVSTEILTRLGLNGGAK